MTTNPYASPVEPSDPADRADREIRSIIRTFRFLAIFSIAFALLACYSMLHSVVIYSGRGANVAVEISLIILHAPIIGYSILYLRVARKMARREPNAANWSRWLCLLMMASFPLFPIGLICLPVFPLIGFLCFRKIGRYYPEYCKMTELQNAEGLTDLDGP